MSRPGCRRPRVEWPDRHSANAHRGSGRALHVLLFGAGLFVRSLRRVEAQDLGFSTSRLLLATLDFRNAVAGPDRDRAYLAAAERLTSVRGVTGATVVEAMPFGNFNVPPISVPGRAEPPSVGGQLPYLYAATPTYLRLMGVTLRDGRLFTETDRRGSSLVVLVNETMARSLWPGQERARQVYSRGLRSRGRAIAARARHASVSRGSRRRPRLARPLHSRHW